ncbi:stage II sporulation protein M [Candidatus Woesearchaeota archaeon]|nr:stage II sporulation protein M [Candidatus Woesearchaeota archaeon]
MVLETLITPWKAEKSPWEMFFYGFLYTSIAIFISLWIFRDYAGLVSVFITVMACIPLLYGTFKMEEEKISYFESESSLLKEHGKALSFFAFLFIGMTLAFATWYVVMPVEVSESVFSVQSKTILAINGSAAGGVELFYKIFFNNIKVLTFCLLFSFLFGAGSIFILTWNASVIAVAMGSLIKTFVFQSTAGPFMSHLGGYAGAIMRYFLHGVPEVMAYFVAALAGGIISTAIIKKDMGTKKFQKIAFDTSNLILLSVAILFLAGIIEAYITPYFY